MEESSQSTPSESLTGQAPAPLDPPADATSPAPAADQQDVVVVEDEQAADVSPADTASADAAAGDAEPSAAAPAATAQAPAVELTPAQQASAVEAILFATDSPLTAARVAQVARLGGIRIAKEIIAGLNEKYEQMGCAFRIENLAGGYQMLTQSEHHEVLARLFRARSETKLSAASLETLAVVAYRQPILRADIEAIRGVASGEVLRTLMERQLVKIVGRAEVLGRPMLYGTTRKFLEVFGLSNLDDLPNVEELRGGKETPPAAAPAATPAEAPAQAPANGSQVAADAPQAASDQPPAEQTPAAPSPEPAATSDEPAVEPSEGGNATPAE